jgi:hypothetical protein
MDITLATRDIGGVFCGGDGGDEDGHENDEDRHHDDQFQAGDTASGIPSHHEPILRLCRYRHTRNLYRGANFKLQASHETGVSSVFATGL